MGPVAVSRDSSVGRAEDCRTKEAILRSLVRIRFARIFFFSNPKLCAAVPRNIDTYSPSISTW